MAMKKEIKNDEWKKLVRKEIGKIKPYIPGKPISEVKEELGLDEVVKMASNENPLPVSEKVRKAIEDEIANINLYPDGGSRSLIADLSEKLSVDENMIMCGNGSDGIIKVIGETFLDRESQVIISYPSFVEYNFISQLMGTHIIRVWIRNYKQNLDGIVEACSSNTDMIFITNPDNPTGTMLTKNEIDKFLSQIPDDTIVVLDEAYHEYVQNEDYPDGIEYVKQGYPVIVLRTFSKAYGLAGVRLGYAVAQPEMIEMLMKARDPFNVNRLAEMAGKAALGDENFLKESIEVNEKGKEYLYQEFEKMGLNYVPTKANFILVNIQADSMKVFEKMLAKGVIIRPGKPLGYPEHIRVTNGLPEENKKFIKVLKEVLGEV